MTKLNIASYHPIRLQSIQYIKFAFERRAPEEPGDDLIFPDFEIEVMHNDVINDTTAFMLISLNSKEELPSWVEDRSKEPVVNFNLIVSAYFTCVEFEGSRLSIQEFIRSETPTLIVWPYMRSFVADMLNRTGLPEYHLPLLRIHTDRSTFDEQKNDGEK